MKSGFNDFLAARKRAGDYHSSGVFTLSLSKAVLEKLANYQFEFEGAWIVKLIQAAVARDETNEISIRMTRLGMQIQFQASWDMADVESGLIGSLDDMSRDLEHLVTSLRLLAFREKRPFELRLPGEISRLVWRDGDVSRVKPEDDQDVEEHCTLTLEFCKRLRDLNEKSVAQHRAELTHALEMYGRVCPVPIRLDGRQINCLFRREVLEENVLATNNQLSIPLKGGFKSSELPQWNCPPDTRSYTNTLPPRGKCSIPYLQQLTSHQEQGRARAKTSFAFEMRTKTSLSSLQSAYTSVKSRIQWIGDGVICQTDELPMAPNNIAVELFCSAAGLQHDISGLKIRETSEYHQRYRTAMKIGLEVIDDLELYLGFSDIADFKPGIIALGLAGAVTSLVLPAPMIAKSLLVVVSGAVGLRGKRASIRLPDLDRALSELQVNWRQALDETPDIASGA